MPVARIGSEHAAVPQSASGRCGSAAVSRVTLPKPTQTGRCYAIDFVHDRLVTGRRFKCLTMTDPCSKEVPVIEVDVSIGGARVCRILDRLFATRPLPDTREVGAERVYREVQWQVSG